MRVKKYNTIALLSSLSLALAACGSEGGRTVQLESTSAQRNQAGRAQIAAAEAAARAADKQANPISPNVTIRTGAARSSSMDGTNWSANQVPTAPIASAPQASSSSNNDKSMLLMAGIAAFALFGKEIIKGGSDVMSEAGSALKSVVTPNDKSVEGPKSDQTNDAANQPQDVKGHEAAPTKTGAIQLPGGPTGPQVGVTPGPRSAPSTSDAHPEVGQAAALPAKNIENQQQQVASAHQGTICMPNQNSALTDIKKFWNDAIKGAVPEVKL